MGKAGVIGRYNREESMDSPGSSGRDVREVLLGNAGDLAGCGWWPRWFGI